MKMHAVRSVSRLTLPAVYLVLSTAARLQAQERYHQNWESLRNHQVPDWFRDAKFGIFIHWGVYSVPGAFSSEWYPNKMYLQGSKEFNYHVQKYGPQDKFGYKDFIPMFKAGKFNAASWVALFKKAGAKYVVPVAEHHDGFAMYKTSLSKWNAVDMGPHRDVIGELAAEVRRQGLIFGLSSHRIEHWFFFGGGRKFPSDVLDPQWEDFYGPARDEKEPPSPEFMDNWLIRCGELAEKYQPQLFWFDWWIEYPEMTPYRKAFAAYYYNKGLDWKKDVVLNYKDTAFPRDVAVLDVERGKLNEIQNIPWQTDDAIANNSWGYSRDATYKSPKYVINNLIDIVSKNGNLLLNIGPKPDGTITHEETTVLLEMGKWLDINGEAIYGTRPWKIFGEGPTPSASGIMGDQKQAFTAMDIRFTTKGDVLYAIALGKPDANLVIRSLGTKTEKPIAAIQLMGSADKVSWKQQPDALVIGPLSSYPSDNAVVYKIQFRNQTTHHPDH